MKIFSSINLTMILFVIVGSLTISPAQIVKKNKILVENNQHYAFYRIDEQNLILTLESIDDFTDNTQEGVFPKADSVSVEVDVDQNNEVSKNIDVTYGITGKPNWIKRDWEENPFVRELCTNFLLDKRTSTPCGGFKSEAVLDFGFRSSHKQPQKHPVYKFTIPLKELSNNKNFARVRLRFISAGKDFAYYPPKDNEDYHSFLKTLEIKF